MPVTPEICEVCGKKITRRAVANVFENQVTRTACWRRLTREKEEQEAEQRELVTPATERQIAYAHDLGLTWPSGICKRDMSRLISGHLLQKYRAQAASIGLTYADDESEEALRSRIWRRRTVYAWTISVCRHMLKASWLLYHEAGELAQQILPVVEQIEADDKLVELISEKDEGYTDSFIDDLWDREWTGRRTTGISSARTVRARVRRLT